MGQNSLSCASWESKVFHSVKLRPPNLPKLKKPFSIKLLPKSMMKRTRREEDAEAENAEGEEKERSSLKTLRSNPRKNLTKRNSKLTKRDSTRRRRRSCRRRKSRRGRKGKKGKKLAEEEESEEES